MTPDLETHKAILARLKACESVEDVALAACWGFQHLFEHVIEQNRQILELTSQLADQKSSADQIADGEFL